MRRPMDMRDRQRGKPPAPVGRPGKPPPTILSWGLGEPASMGHNNGPPLDDETPGYLFRRYRWQKAHAAIWKPPSMGVLKFRMARAEAAGVDYRTYMSTLLDRGRSTQARDRDPARLVALNRLRQVWRQLMAEIAPGVPRIRAGIVLASLRAAYDEPGRHYHNLVHVAAVLDGIARHEALITDRPALLAATLFHDVVYDARRADNEKESARVAGLQLGELGVSAATIARISDLILATRHRDADLAAARGDRDMALLLDCDLAILAATGERYLAYAAAVRREYAHVPEAAFRTGRTQVLAGFLARAQLFLTPAIAADIEAPARANLAAEISRLIQGK